MATVDLSRATGFLDPTYFMSPWLPINLGSHGSDLIAQITRKIISLTRSWWTQNHLGYQATVPQWNWKRSSCVGCWVLFLLAVFFFGWLFLVQIVASFYYLLPSLSIPHWKMCVSSVSSCLLTTKLWKRLEVFLTWYCSAFSAKSWYSKSSFFPMVEEIPTQQVTEGGML